MNPETKVHEEGMYMRFLCAISWGRGSCNRSKRWFFVIEGFTSHSGCPVLLGTKRIAVQWMRIGVDKENPWDSFDTNTVPMSSGKVERED